MSSRILSPGKLKCKYLRGLRVKFAKEHGIDYQPAECHHKGDCQGTCPACDSELEFLNNRIKLEKKVLFLIFSIMGTVCSVHAQIYHKT